MGSHGCTLVQRPLQSQERCREQMVSFVMKTLRMQEGIMVSLHLFKVTLEEVAYKCL